MKKLITRRDFLKYAGIGTTGAAAALALAGCSSSSSDDSSSSSSTSSSSGDGEVVAVVVDESERITDYITTTTREVSSWCLFNVSQPTINVLQFLDPLLTVDPHNNIIPCMAESWSNDSTETEWTFNIRKGVKWVDYQGNVKGEVKAEDWLWGLEWVLNFWKNDAYMTSIPLSFIAGAQDYYDYTLGLSEDEAWALGVDKLQEMVGIETPDEYTVVYHTSSSCPFFDSIATSVFMYPLAKGQLDELNTKGYKSVTPFELWCNGPYVISEYVESNTKTMVPNPEYWDDTCQRFDSMTWLLTESDNSWNLFELGLTSTAGLSRAQKESIIQDPSNEWHDYIVGSPDNCVAQGIYFNYAKKKISDDTMDTDWNLAVANENFRKCFYYGLDMYNYLELQDNVDPEGAARAGMTCYGISTLSDGTDYTKLVEDLIDFHPDENYSHQDLDKLSEYKAKAMEELAAEGVTFPIHMDIWSSSTQVSGDQATVLKEMYEDYLGKDLVEVTINTYITSSSSEVYNPSYHSIEGQAYGGLYCDPTTYLNQLANDMSGNAEYADLYGHISECENKSATDLFDEYTKMLREADAITGDHDARLRALAEVEAFAIEHCLLLPVGTSREYGIRCLNEYSLPCAVNDTQKNRYVNAETKASFYTFEEYQAIREAYLAGN